MSLTLLALAGTAAACSSGPQVTAQQKRAVAGILQAPKGSASPSPTRRTTTKTTTTTTPSGTTPTSTSVGPGSSSSTPTSPASGAGTSPSSGQAGSAPTTAAPGAPPNVVGQSLSAAENQLGAAGYGANAQPWGGSCSTPGQVMQQVPPQGGTVRLFYCTKVT
jgi:hypothetical protein